MNINTDELKDLSTWELEQIRTSIGTELYKRKDELTKDIKIGSLITLNDKDGFKLCHLIVDEYDEPGENDYYVSCFKVLYYWISPDGTISTAGFEGYNQDYLYESLRLANPNVTISQTEFKDGFYGKLEREFMMKIIDASHGGNIDDADR